MEFSIFLFYCLQNIKDDTALRKIKAKGKIHQPPDLVKLLLDTCINWNHWTLFYFSIVLDLRHEHIHRYPNKMDQDWNI